MFRGAPLGVPAVCIMAWLALAQTSTRAQQMEMPSEAHWHVMQEAVVIGMFNHQGGPRGGDEFRVPNWWMGMFSRP